MVTREDLVSRIGMLRRQEQQALAMANQAAGAIAALESLVDQASDPEPQEVISAG